MRAGRRSALPLERVQGTRAMVVVHPPLDVQVPDKLESSWMVMLHEKPVLPFVHWAFIVSLLMVPVQVPVCDTARRTSQVFCVMVPVSPPQVPDAVHVPERLHFRQGFDHCPDCSCEDGSLPQPVRTNPALRKQNRKRTGIDF